MARVDKVSHFKSLTRLRDFFKKSHETFETFETFETWKFQCKYTEKWPFDIFIAILCDNFLENFRKKIIVTSLGVKIGMKSAQTIFIAFLCDNFLQNLVFPNHFPCQNIPKNKIIFYETFSKSLTRLSRLF